MTLWIDIQLAFIAIKCKKKKRMHILFAEKEIGLQSVLEFRLLFCLHKLKKKGMMHASAENHQRFFMVLFHKPEKNFDLFTPRARVYLNR